MIKLCLSVTLFALAALPLAHGCGDSSVECLGSAVACENREVSACDAGCRVQSGCLGDAVACETLTDNPTLCLQTPGCRYVGSCEGAEGCSRLEFEVCGQTEGCLQVRRCYGDGTRCEDLEDSLCELYPECALTQRCTGSAISCGDLDTESQCLSVPGCFPADTTPSVVE